MEKDYKIKLSPEARAFYNRKSREWRKAHPDKVREYNTRYWEKKASLCTIEDEARELSRQGLSQRQIAERLNISLGKVNAILNAE